MNAVTKPGPEDFNQLDDETFRLTIRHWVEASYPAELRNPPKRLHFSENKIWYMMLARKRLARARLAARARRHGALSRQAAHLHRGIRASRLRARERSWRHQLGPLLIRYGTQAQKDFFLPKILTGDHIWCQGYSEPNAGSDLASLATSAVLDGDDYVVNGQKIWTTLATDANWIFLLVRTDRSAKKQEGISFLLVPMDSPRADRPADHQHRSARRVLRDVLRQRPRAGEIFGRHA